MEGFGNTFIMCSGTLFTVSVNQLPGNWESQDP